MNEFTVTFICVSVAIFLLTAVAERILIPILRSHKMGQRILDIGPRWHKSKEGTPIMGGIGFILSTVLVMAVLFIFSAVRGRASELIPLAMTLAFAVGNGMIGFIDDYYKLVKKQNEGLTRMQKLVLQLTFSGAYVSVMAYTGYLGTTLALPFSDASIDFGWAFYPIAVIVLTGVVNGGNITDGIDGLASSVTCVIGVFYGILAFVTFDDSLSMVSAILIGATLGFLLYNFHPARVFMGDTGSLFLGALAISAAFGSGNGAVGVIICAVFVLEMLSSFLQIVYFKLTHGKRLFKMAPFHHHLEQCGWGENRIVAVFTLVEVAFCALAWFAFYH